MRVVVYGTSGSGKSTFAADLAGARNVPCIELDLINWRPGWIGRNKTDIDGFKEDVETAIAIDAWVASDVRDRMWKRATDVVYLDLPRVVIVRQVIVRSFQRAFSGEDVFPGCREHWWRMASAEHPIRWAWSTFHRRRDIYEGLIRDPQNAHLTLHRCLTRTQIAATLLKLSQQRPD